MDPPGWAWIRRRLAHEWGVPPWEVDRAPWREVSLELRLMQIEGEVEQWKQQHKR